MINIEQIKKIAIVGLGLIGGSFAKTIQKHTHYQVFAYDRDASVLKQALQDHVIDGVLNDTELSQFDLVIVCLYPEATIDYINRNALLFKKNAIIIDVCGAKEYICNHVFDAMSKSPAHFLGAHPMAGREVSGYEASLETLFDDASFIFTPLPDTPADVVQTMLDFSSRLHFARTQTASPDEHDRIIAFTSQMPHIISNAYVKSSASDQYMGFAAGSFEDLSRVAKLNEEMWASLFLFNQPHLQEELDTLIQHLQEYQNALLHLDRDRLKELLKDGRIKKEYLTQILRNK